MIEEAEHGKFLIFRNYKKPLRRFFVVKSFAWYNIFMSKRNIIIFLSIFIVVPTLIFLFLRVKTYPDTIIVNNHVFNVEVADNAILLEKGLSGHAPLSSTEGMFFVFKKPDNYKFWMKDMTFPIDIIWFDSNFKIIHIEKSVDPSSYPKAFYPNSSALYVLEIKSGESDKIGLKIGDVVSFSKK